MKRAPRLREPLRPARRARLGERHRIVSQAGFSPERVHRDGQSLRPRSWISSIL